MHVKLTFLLVAFIVEPDRLHAQVISRFERVRQEAEAANRVVSTTETTCASTSASYGGYKYVFTLKRWKRVGTSEAVAFEIVEARRDQYNKLLDLTHSPVIDWDRVQDVLSFASELPRTTTPPKNERTTTRLVLPGGEVVQSQSGSKSMDLGRITYLGDSRLSAVRELLGKAVGLGGSSPCNH